MTVTAECPFTAIIVSCVTLFVTQNGMVVNKNLQRNNYTHESSKITAKSQSFRIFFKLIGLSFGLFFN